MDDWIMGLPQWAWTLVLLASAFLAALTKRRKTLQRAHEQGLPVPAFGKSCQNCLHWDLEAGKQALAKNPAFAQAASVLSPNTMMASSKDSDGDSNGDRKLLPMAEDRWDYIGACMGYEELRQGACYSQHGGKSAHPHR